MSLILYPANETAFDTNGIGILSDAVDDEVYEELNGQFELTVQYPVDGIHFSDIVTDAYITAKPNPVSDPQPFRIYRITKPMKGTVTIYARHYAYKNKKIVVSPFTAANAPAALQSLKNNAVNACPFEFWTDKDTATAMTVSVPTDIWTLLGGSQGSILDTYGGEYEFDKATVMLWNRRGKNRGVTIRYGKNLTDLKQDENIANVFTGVYPYWLGSDGTLIQLPERYINGPGTYDEEKIMPLDLSQEFETEPTEDQLRERTEKYITDNDIGKPDISWTVEFIQLEQTEEYKGKALLERVLLGDTVSVFFPKLNVNASARAVAARYKPTLGRYKNITLGKVKSNLASTIVQQGQTITQITRPSSMQAAVDRATKWITSGKGYMVAVRDENGVWQEICSLDTPDINQALNVWRWNNGGLGHSKNGYNGPFEVALTQDGQIVADFITAGTLDAAQVKVINLVADNISSGTLDASKITVVNLTAGSIVSGILSSADGMAYFDLDKSQIVVTAGSTTGVSDKGNKACLMGGGLLLLNSDSIPLFKLASYNNQIQLDALGDMSLSATGDLLIMATNLRWNDMSLVWSDNGNGIYTLMGRKVTS